jgi:hypothetical protein
MTAEQAFLALFERFAKGKISPTITVGTVASVDAQEDTCEVERDGQPTLYDVRLNAIVDTLGTQVTVYPAVGSYVMCIAVDSQDYVIIKTSAIDKIKINGDIVINGGDNGGMVKAPDLETQLNKLTVRVDGIINALSNSPTVPQDGGAAYKASIVTALQLLTDKEDFSDIQDLKVTH